MRPPTTGLTPHHQASANKDRVSSDYGAYLPRRAPISAALIAVSGATMIPVIVAELLDELAHSLPDLPGAACRGHPELFDVADRHDHQAVAQAKGSAPKRPD